MSLFCNFGRMFINVKFYDNLVNLKPNKNKKNVYNLLAKKK